MIVGWIVKLVVSIGLLGVLVFEVGSPLVARVQVDEAAHRVADTAAIEYFESNDLAAARAEGEKVAKTQDVVITKFDLTEQGPLRVTVAREAKSIVMAKFDFAKRWYEISANAESLPRRREL